jgi:hypothetical protein
MHADGLFHRAPASGFPSTRKFAKRQGNLALALALALALGMSMHLKIAALAAAWDSCFFCSSSARRK